MFNVLPDDLRDPAVSITTFGRSMKTHLFSAYQHFQHIRGVLRNALHKCTILNYLLNKSKPIDARVIKSGIGVIIPDHDMGMILGSKVTHVSMSM